MPNFTHRPTYPDNPDSHERTRAIYVDGEFMGDATMIDMGPDAGRWRYGVPGAHGVADTLAEALAAIREGFPNADPAEIETWRRQQAGGRRGGEAWANRGKRRAARSGDD